MPEPLDFGYKESRKLPSMRNVQSIWKTEPIRIPTCTKMCHMNACDYCDYQISGSSRILCQALGPETAISILDKKPRALKDKGCESPGLFLGDADSSLDFLTWNGGVNLNCFLAAKILQVSNLKSTCWIILDSSASNISTSNPDPHSCLSASSPDPVLGLGDQCQWADITSIPCCLASRSI